MKKIINGLLICLVLLTACGRKGPPKPPENFAPAPVEGLVVAANPEGVKFTWKAPAITMSGTELTDLSHFIIKKSFVKKGKKSKFKPVVKVNPERVKKNVVYWALDKNVIPGGKYQYVVVAVNNDGVEGPYPYITRVTFIGLSSVIESSS